MGMVRTKDTTRAREGKSESEYAEVRGRAGRKKSKKRPRIVCGKTDGQAYKVCKGAKTNGLLVRRRLLYLDIRYIRCLLTFTCFDGLAREKEGSRDGNKEARVEKEEDGGENDEANSEGSKVGQSRQFFFF